MSKSDTIFISLRDLMCRAQQGDKVAYAAFFRNVTPLIRAFIGKRLFNRSDIDDVLQEILLSLHRATHTYDPERPIKLWIYAIARYRLNDHLRRHYKKQKAGFRDVCIDDLTFELPAEDVTSTPDMSEYLNEALRSLPTKQTKIVTLMKLEGQTAEETAKSMNMSVSAVRVAAHRAYKALAVKLENKKDID